MPASQGTKASTSMPSSSQASSAQPVATSKQLLAWPSSSTDSAALLSLVTDGHRYARALRRLDVLANHVAERVVGDGETRLFKQDC
ncbi:hypothetical protein NFJ02_27g64290 [Pycnococcus provasolii]|mmetsp:Transcript_15472/g.39161  ORF Transcript_15472/g.39161 Transcript_15472/m.39161 type:complete len:86 (+) Transcript_15472:239-496(+)